EHEAELLVEGDRPAQVADVEDGGDAADRMQSGSGGDLHRQSNTPAAPAERPRTIAFRPGTRGRERRGSRAGRLRESSVAGAPVSAAAAEGAARGLAPARTSPRRASTAKPMSGVSAAPPGPMTSTISPRTSSRKRRDSSPRVPRA